MHYGFVLLDQSSSNHCSFRQKSIKLLFNLSYIVGTLTEIVVTCGYFGDSLMTDPMSRISGTSHWSKKASFKITSTSLINSQIKKVMTNLSHKSPPKNIIKCIVGREKNQSTPEQLIS